MRQRRGHAPPFARGLFILPSGLDVSKNLPPYFLQHPWYKPHSEGGSVSKSLGRKTASSSFFRKSTSSHHCSWFLRQLSTFCWEQRTNHWPHACIYVFVINEYLSQPAKLGKFYLLMAALLLPSEGASFIHCWMRKVGMFWDGHDCFYLVDWWMIGLSGE